MEHSRSDQSAEDSCSRPPRSRASSGVSSTQGLFYNLALVDSPRSLQFAISRPASSQETHSPAFITPAPPSSATLLATSSTTPSYSSLPLPSQSGFSPEWSESRNQPFDTPLLRVDLVQDSPPPPSPTRSTTTTATMSTVAVHFDSRFDLGMPRSSFGWPGMDSGADLLGHGLTHLGGAESDGSFTPPSISRSVTASPPRASMTTQQRELKRQRDQARRDSKTSVRARRALSSSYGSQSPPASVSEYSSASAMPIYSTSPSQISLLAEPVTTMASQNYISSYSSPMPDQGGAMFTSQFSSLPSSSYMGMDYSSGFPPSSSTQNMNSQFNGRPTSMPEQSMLYPVGTVLPSGTGPAQDGGHVRVVQSRPKPQCWEHGCNGRQFSTFSNLLRHQREKSGQASKASCPNCGAEFTRTTARNGHLLHDKCKQRRNS